MKPLVWRQLIAEDFVHSSAHSGRRGLRACGDGNRQTFQQVVTRLQACWWRRGRPRGRHDVDQPATEPRQATRHRRSRRGVEVGVQRETDVE
jgi:hypothetical protein